MLNQTRAHPGIARESKFQGPGISHGHYDHFGGLVGFLSANKGKLKRDLPFFVGGEDCFCMRETDAGQYGALDRKAITDAKLSLDDGAPG